MRHERQGLMTTKSERLDSSLSQGASDYGTMTVILGVLCTRLGSLEGFTDSLQAESGRSLHGSFVFQNKNHPR